MTDTSLIGATAIGDAWGREAAYDAYADGLHTYCLSLLQDHDVAADALYDTFVVADHHISHARDAERLKAWLYAIARNECLRRIRGDVAVSHYFTRRTDESMADLERNLRRAELQSLLWPEAQGLDPRDRETLELSVRHGLAGRDLARVMGTTPEYAHAVLSQAWQDVELTRAALAVAVSHATRCPDRDRLVAGWDGNLTSSMRRRLVRHLERCGECEEAARSATNGSMLPGMLPLVSAPRVLRDRILGDLGAGRMRRKHTEIVKRTQGASHFDTDGFPMPYDRKPARRAWRWPAAASLAVLVICGAGYGLWQLNSPTGSLVADPGLNGVQHGPGQWDSSLDKQPLPAGHQVNAGGHPPTSASPDPGLARVIPPADRHPTPPGPNGRPVSPAPTPAPTSQPPAPGRLALSTSSIDMGQQRQTTVTLSNSGASALDWRADFPTDRFSLDTASGILQPGKPVTITINLLGDQGKDWQSEIVFRSASGDLTLSVNGKASVTASPVD